MATDEKNFFQKTIQHLARSLASQKEIPWEKVNSLCFIISKKNTERLLDILKPSINLWKNFIIFDRSKQYIRYVRKKVIKGCSRWIKEAKIL